MKIELKKCTISYWNLSYVDDLILQANNPKIANNLRDIFPSPYTKKEAIHWIEFNQKQTQQSNFPILVNGKVAGVIGFKLGTDVHRCNAEIGYWLGEQYWGQGIVSEACTEMVEYAFEQYKITRLFAGVFEKNVASMRVLEKSGFQLEQIIKKSIIKQGEIMNEHVYSIVR